jgi:hypothetical protein
MATLRPAAVLVAFFGGYVVPAALLFAAGAAAVNSSDGNSFSSPAFSALILSSYVAFPLLAGFLAGSLAHQAPFLHAIAASLLGSAMYAFMHESITLPEGVWWVVVNVAGAIAGAWFSTRTKKRSKSNGLQP